MMKRRAPDNSELGQHILDKMAEARAKDEPARRGPARAKWIKALGDGATVWFLLICCLVSIGMALYPPSVPRTIAVALGVVGYFGFKKFARHLEMRDGPEQLVRARVDELRELSRKLNFDLELTVTWCDR